MIDKVRRYWPVAILLPVAFLIDAALFAVGDPWSAADWGSNIVFAYVITIATVLLSQKQQRLQVATADSELVEKIGAIRGNLDRVTLHCEASAVQQLLLDARAGFHLVPFADSTRRDEYFTTVEGSIKDIDDMITGSVRAYTRWDQASWGAILDATARLRHTAEELAGKKDKSRAPFRQLAGRLEEFERNASLPRAGNQGVPIPYEAFERSFRRGDVNQIVRVMLNWDLLGQVVRAGRGSVALHRSWSKDLIESHRVFSAWYVTESNSFGQYHDTKAMPILFEDIDKYYEILPQESKETIEAMARWLEHRPTSSLPTVELVTLEVGHNDILVLDGNHRMASLTHRRPRRPRISAVTVEYRIRVDTGLDDKLLPDLCHYLRE